MVADTSAASQDPDGLGHGQRPHHAVGGHGPEEAPALLGRLPAARRAGTNWAAVARKGAGARTRPSSSATTASSTNPSPMPPSSSGDGQGGPVELDHPGPELVGPLALLHHAPDERRWALALEHGAHRGLQLALVVGQLEVHGDSSSGDGGPGAGLAGDGRLPRTTSESTATAPRGRTTTGLRSSSARRSPQAAARRATARTTSTRALTSARAWPRAPQEQGVAAQRLHHLLGVAAVEGQRADGDVLEDLGEDAAGAHEDGGTVDGVAGDAHDHLDAPLHLLLDLDTLDPRLARWPWWPGPPARV